MPFCCHWVKSPTSMTLMAVGAVKRKVCFLEFSNCLAITDCPFHDSDCFARQEVNHACHPASCAQVHSARSHSHPLSMPTLSAVTPASMEKWPGKWPGKRPLSCFRKSPGGVIGIHAISHSKRSDLFAGVHIPKSNCR